MTRRPRRRKRRSSRSRPRKRTSLPSPAEAVRPRMVRPLPIRQSRPNLGTKKSQSKPAPEKPAVDKGGAPAGAESRRSRLRPVTPPAPKKRRSSITNPKLHSNGRFLHYGAWLGTERQPSYKERLRLAINEALTKRPADFDAFLRLMEASGFTVKHGRGGVISFLVPGQERATRLRASTLGDGYNPETSRPLSPGSVRSRSSLFLRLLPLAVSI